MRGIGELGNSQEGLQFFIAQPGSSQFDDTVITINIIVLFLYISDSSSEHMIIGLPFFATLELEMPSDLFRLMKVSRSDGYCFGMKPLTVNI